MSKQYDRIETEMEIDRTGTRVYILIRKETRLDPQEIMDACIDVITDYCGITPEQLKFHETERDGGLN